MKYVQMLLLVTLCLSASDYRIGSGYKVNDSLHFNGYLSTRYSMGNGQNAFLFEDLALLAYGNLNPKLSYSIELEAYALYSSGFKTQVNTPARLTHIERAYFDYSFSDSYNIRVGKQITPIGYWNYTPINVLRDTTSNPVYSFKMFPKLLTGIDLYGQLREDSHISYHLFMQDNKDINENAVNIQSKYFYGLSLNYDSESATSFGGAVGRYKIRYTNNVVDLLQGNMKSLYGNNELKSELAYRTIKQPNGVKVYQLSGYIQDKYNLTDKHALIGRYEYNDNALEVNRIRILGYSYRPLYPVSFKLEYQWHSKVIDNKTLFSFSVLF